MFLGFLGTKNMDELAIDAAMFSCCLRLKPLKNIWREPDKDFLVFPSR
jgi:hypothetical protein